VRAAAVTTAVVAGIALAGVLAALTVYAYAGYSLLVFMFRVMGGGV
jgi:hypothetical protein